MKCDKKDRKVRAFRDEPGLIVSDKSIILMGVFNV